MRNEIVNALNTMLRRGKIEDMDIKNQIITTGDGALTLPTEIHSDIITQKARFKSIREFIDVVPVLRSKGTYSTDHDGNYGELVELTDVSPEIAENDLQLVGMKYNIRDFASFSPIASRIVEDSSYDLVQYFEKVHAEKAVKTENKIVFNTIRTSKVAKALADISALKTSLNKDLSPSLENEIVIVTNQDGYELFNNLDSNVNPVKTVTAGDNSQKRYLDVYRFEVYSNEELPSQNGKVPFIYGSLERSVKLFDLEMIDILLIHYPFGNRSMVHVLRGIEHFDVEIVPETPYLIYGEIPLPVV